MSTPSAAPEPPFSQTREFWALMGYAVVLGVVGALAGLVFMGVTGFGGGWYDDTDPGWFGGQWWWVAVTGAAGLAVGLLRWLTHHPDKAPGLVEGLESGQVEPGQVPAFVGISAVSLIGGASLGPELALGSLGGGAGTWLSRRRGLSTEDSQVNTWTGFAGAYGGLFSSTVIVVMLIMEVARPGGQRLTKTLVGTIVASSVSFGIYFSIAGAVFLDVYPVPAFAFEDWHLLAGVALGLVAAVLVSLLGVVLRLVARLFDALHLPGMVRPVVAGLLFGIVGVALPLTLFTGSDELGTLLDHSGSLSAGLLAALVVAKMVTFGIAESGGFVGGPIFPVLFIGGAAGVLVHTLLPGVPVGLSFTCLIAAVPGALVSAPFAMVLLAAFVTQVGALETAPVLISVVTAFLAVEGVKYVVHRRQERAASHQPG